MDKYVLGLNISNHDSAAALIKNGELLKFIEQERISRNKMALGEPPIDAIKKCLSACNITINDISAISVGMDWKYRNEIYKMTVDEQKKYKKFEDPKWFLPKEFLSCNLPPIHFIRHHLAHASSAYRLSGFKDCAVLVIDNRGEDSSTSLGIAQNGKITFFKQINIHNSLGIYYNRAARFTGLYGKYREVGKFMGLASYGVPSFKMPLSPSRDKLLFKTLPNIENLSIFDSIGARTQQFKEYFERNCFPYESENSEEIMSYANFAASVQKSLEDTILDFIKELKEVTNMDNIVISGGVALNCSVNGKIEQSGLFNNIYIPPFSSDAGTAVGAALEVYRELYDKNYISKPLKNVGLGLSYSDEEIINELKAFSSEIKFNLLSDNNLSSFVANEISKGKIIGWMQGCFEAGPRSLGYRSILADPRKRRSLIKLNRIKEREMWRPIAPSVLFEEYSSYFEGSPYSKYFMNVATIVKPLKRNIIPAVVHVDYSARPQVVTNKQKKYYDLIKAFYSLTGVPVLCNTSFNRRGEPLVNSPKDAIECFLNTSIDLLVIGNYVVERV